MGYGSDMCDKVSHLLKSLWDKLFKTRFYHFEHLIRQKSFILEAKPSKIAS